MGNAVSQLRSAVLAAAFARLTPASQAKAAARSGAVKVGAVTETACGEELSVYRTPNGGVLIFGDTETALAFDPAALAGFRELLDRAAMPGTVTSKPAETKEN